MTFKKLVLATIGFVLEYGYQLGRALLIPLLLYIFIELIISVSPNAALTVILAFSQVFLQILIAVTTHRMLLLGPQAVPKWGILKWSRRETRFACYAIGLFCFIFIAAVVSSNSVIAPIVFLLFFGLVAPRLSLVFPAIAIDKKCSFKESWHLTKNWKSLMFFAVVLIPITFSIPILLLSTIPFTMVITVVLSTCLEIFFIAALSISYKVISESAELV